MTKKQIKSGVYLIKNTKTGKYYVGSSVNIQIRWANHKTLLKSGRHTNSILQADYNLFGAEIFEYSILELIDSPEIETIRIAEQKWTDQLNACDLLIGYNIIPDSQHKFVSEQTKERMRKSKLGKKLSPEHSASISKGLKGREIKLDHRAKISATLLKKSGKFESLEKCREYVQKGGFKAAQPKLTKEEKSKRISNGLKGHHTSEATRQKISEANRGKVRLSRRSTTLEQRIEIRQKHSNGQNISDLAREYQLSRTTIRNTIRKRFGD